MVCLRGEMKRQKYFNEIEERLNTLATRIRLRGKLNILDLNIHAESFYQNFLNELYGWSLINQNEMNQNAEAIDLIDHQNKFVIQVSSTASKKKIESSLSKNSIQQYNGYTFKFVSIASDADRLKKDSYQNPFRLSFNPVNDILDINTILQKIKYSDTNLLEKIWLLVNQELTFQINTLTLESNLATVINILSKENWNHNESIKKMITFEIERKISFNNIFSAKIIIDDYKLYHSKVDKIYAEFDKEGINKSQSVLLSIRQEYARLKAQLADDELFFTIITNVQEKIINSANFTAIPVEELEFCVNILIVDAFIRCKIFENPNENENVTT